MDGFFTPESTGKRLQQIAKWFAVLALLTAVIGGLLLLTTESDGNGINDAGLSAGVLLGAVAAEVFCCLLLHGFGVLVDNSYQQRLEAEKQTALLQRLLEASQGTPAEVEPVKRALNEEKTPVKFMPKKPAPVERSIMSQEQQQAMIILGHLLGIHDEEKRSQYLQKKIEGTESEALREICQKAIGLTNEQIVQLMDTL